MITEPYSQMLDGLDFNAVNAAAGESVYDVALKVISGELDLSLGGVVRRLIQPLFRELTTFSSLLREMVVIAVLGAILSAISINLRNKNVSEMGFYVLYIIIIALLMDSFYGCIAVMRGFADNLGRFVEAAAPMMVSLLLLSGNPASASVLNPLAMFAAGGVQFVIRDIIGPALIFAAVLEIVNNLSQRDMLSRLAELIKKCVTISLITLAGLFAGVLTLHRIAAPIADNAAAKAARYAVNAVPVVGQALSGAVDIAVMWSGTAKSAVMTAIIIMIVLMCVPVIIQTAAFTIAYKLTAALIEPICDKRIVNAVNAAGSLASIALAACVLAAAAFIFMVMIIISL